MTKLEKKSQFEVRDDLGIESLGDELLLLDKQNEKIHRLNRTAAMIWHALAAGRDPEQIATELIEVFDTTLENARNDVDQVTASLVSLKLVSVASANRVARD